MRLVLSHQLFAAKGDQWNTPNYQNNADPIIRHRRGFSGELREVEVAWGVEGYGADGQPAKAPVRRAEPNRAAPIARTFEGQRRSLWAEGEHYHAPEELRGKSQPLTEDQLQLRKRQRALVKARQTRARNRLARAEAARRAAVEAMAVKLSQGRF